jgi:hypothetical protein
VELLAAASFLATLASGFAVGGRLLALSRATRRGPELFLGLAVTLLALAAVVELAALELARAGRLGPAYPVEVVALLLHGASSASLCLGVWRIFHAREAWAAALALALTLLLLASWLAVIWPGEHTSVAGFSLWFHVHVAARGAAFAWGAAAAGTHYERLRRRRALGLVEPFLCHRFLLWTLALASSAGILATALLTNTLLGVLVFAWPPALLAVSVLGLVGAAALWCAFLPPAAYRRFVDARASAALR